MYKNCLGYYIDQYDTILPDDTSLGSIAATLWYQYIKPKFDDTVWADFYDREVFNNHKYPSDDIDSAYANIVKTIKIRLINKSRIYEQMFKSFMADFNPLWNVDGVTGRITESTHTGTDADAHTGYDTLKDTGGHSNTKSGNQELEFLGKEKTNYNGKEDLEYLGTEYKEYVGSEKDTKSGTLTETDSNTTYDSSTFYDTHKKVTQPSLYADEKTFTGRRDNTSFTNRKDEKTFTNRNDELEFTNRKDKTTYNSVKDQFSYDISGENHQTTYASTLTKTLNLTDKDLEMIIRQGNIGVTRSDELLQHALELFDNYLYDWVKYVVMDCIDQVSYAIW